MVRIEFDAYEYRADRSFALTQFAFDGDSRSGFTVQRDGSTLLELGGGYRALRVRSCGVCSTDLARHFLPFPLPQVIGHEVLAVDPDGRRFVVEINASHAARGMTEHDCLFCRAGLQTHCPDRVTLGIDRLPGGFGPWLLAPVAACIEVPESVGDDTAVLLEPFAAALHAVRRIAPKPGDRIAVLGPRRLGMLVIAALAATRESFAKDEQFSVHALLRSATLVELAREMGADEVHRLDVGAGCEPQSFDVVIDTTGSPAGLEIAVALARREVHLKSTHGQPSCGLQHLTDLVVAELSIVRYEAADLSPRTRVAWLASTPVDDAARSAQADVRGGELADLVVEFAAVTAGRDGAVLPRADVAVVDCVSDVDRAIRPSSDHSKALLRPRGSILLHPEANAGGSPLLAAIAARGLKLTSSRCGDFRDALQMLAASPHLRGLGSRFVTHSFAASELPAAFRIAGTRDCIKAVVRHS